MRKLQNIMSLNGPILVTGHTGFKGAWLTSLLNYLEIPWFGYSLAPEKDSLYTMLGLNHSGREMFGDIRDEKSVQKAFNISKPAALIHLAAQPLVLRSYAEPKYTFDVNVMGTANVLDAARLCPNLKYAVVATTDKVYENEEDGNAFKETDPLGGHDPYSASKAGTEMVVKAWRNLKQNGNTLEITSVRSGNVIGGGDSSENRLMPDLIRGFLTGETIHIRNPRSVRPWQHVIDPLLGYLSLLDYGIENSGPKAVNFGPDGRGLTVSEVVERAVEVWAGPTKVEFVESDPLLKEANTLELDSSWARKFLDWENLYTQYEAVTSTVSWWRQVLVMNNKPEHLVRDEIEEKLSRIFAD